MVGVAKGVGCCCVVDGIYIASKRLLPAFGQGNCHGARRCSHVWNRSLSLIKYDSCWECLFCFFGVAGSKQGADDRNKDSYF